MTAIGLLLGESIRRILLVRGLTAGGSASLGGPADCINLETAVDRFWTSTVWPWGLAASPGWQEKGAALDALRALAVRRFAGQGWRKGALEPVRLGLELFQV